MTRSRPTSRSRTTAPGWPSTRTSSSMPSGPDPTSSWSRNRSADTSRRSSRRRIGARLIVLVAAMVPMPGETAEEMFANTGWQPESLADSSARSVFYHDVPSELADQALAHERRSIRHPGSPAVAASGLAGHPDPFRPVPQ